jgi:hypothetical protein
VAESKAGESTEEAPIAPTLSNVERMVEAPAPDAPPGMGGGEATGWGVGGGPPDPEAGEMEIDEEDMTSIPPAVLRPTETPTVTSQPMPTDTAPVSIARAAPTETPTSVPPTPTIVPTLEPSRQQATMAAPAPPSRSATAVAELAPSPAGPTPAGGAYGVRPGAQGGIPLIRLVEIALLLIVLALVSASIASRQRR